MEVHRQLGCGFLEPVYQEALSIELSNCAIPFRRELKFTISYKATYLMQPTVRISSVLIL